MATKEKNGQVQEIDYEQALQIVQQAQQNQVQAFLEEYKALCQKYGMELAPQTSLVVRTVPNDQAW